MDTLYLKIGQNVEVHEPDITLKDVGKMTCGDDTVINRLNTVKLVNVHDKDYARYTVSVLAVIEKIHEVYPNLEVNNIGESEFVLTYKKLEEKKVWNFIKIALVCLITFFGSAFTIMTFNSDVGLPDLFHNLYERVMGHKQEGISILEISYSVGLALGIIVFFNHFFGRKLTKDPTPLEVEMRLYEDDVNTMLLETNTRKEYQIDVD